MTLLHIFSFLEINPTLTIVDAALEQLAGLLQLDELLLGEEGVVGAVALVRPRRPRRHRHRAQVQVVPDRVLQLVVQPALREPRVQVLPQVRRYRTWKSIEKGIWSYIGPISLYGGLLLHSRASVCLRARYLSFAALDLTEK